jgi:hypothetical protein
LLQKVAEPLTKGVLRMNSHQLKLRLQVEKVAEPEQKTDKE